MADGRYEAALALVASTYRRAIVAVAAGVLVVSSAVYLAAGQRLPSRHGRRRFRARLPACRRARRWWKPTASCNHIEQFLRETPEIESYSRRTGARLALAIAEPNTGDFLIKLKKTAQPLARRSYRPSCARKITESEPAIEVEFPHILEDLVGDLAWSPQPIEIKIYNDDRAVTRRSPRPWKSGCPRSKAWWISSTRPSSSVRPINFRVDPAKAQRAGFGVQDVADLEAAILDGELASNMIRGDRLIGIRVRYPRRVPSSHRRN